MPNTFLTPTIIAKRMATILEPNTVMAGLVARDDTQEFTARKVGGTVKVRVPAPATINEFTSTTSADTLTETEVEVTIEKHFYRRVPLTSSEMTLSLEDFSKQVVEPTVIGLANAIDAYVLSKYTEIPYFVGTAGAPPNIIDDIMAVDERLNDLMVPTGPRYAVVNPKCKRTMLGSIETLIRADARGDAGTALRLASMGEFGGLSWLMDQQVKSHTAGTYAAGSPNVNGAVAAGATTMAIEGGSGSETIKAGDIFTVAGALGQYVFTADKTATAGAIAAATFYPAAPAGGFANDAAITIVGSHVANLAFHPLGITLAVVPPEPFKGAGQSAVVNYRGFGVRVSFMADVSSLTENIIFDVMVGAKIRQRELCCRILG